MTNKRQKLDDIKEKFHTGLFEEASITTIEKAFKESKPYLHCKIDTLVNDQLLRNVRQEILSNISFTLKETDIYKVKIEETSISKNINLYYTYRSTRRVI